MIHPSLARPLLTNNQQVRFDEKEQTDRRLGKYKKPSKLERGKRLASTASKFCRPEVIKHSVKCKR